jgi:hypothetical protein
MTVYFLYRTWLIQTMSKLNVTEHWHTSMKFCWTTTKNVVKGTWYIVSTILPEAYKRFTLNVSCSSFFQVSHIITSKLWTHLEHIRRTLVLPEWCRIMDKIFILQITIFYEIYSISWEYYMQLATPWWSKDRVATFCHILISNS